MTMSRRKKLQDLHNRIDIITDLRRLNGDSPTTWRGKLVIPVRKWESIFSRNVRRALEYIPNGYTNYYEQESNIRLVFENLDKVELKLWQEDYVAYLEFIGNPVRGRLLCQGCLLEPSSDIFGLRRMIANTLVASGQLKLLGAVSQKTDASMDNGNDQNSNQQGLSCSVYNRFKCPYKGVASGRDDNFLVGLGQNIAHIEAALSFSSEFNEDAIEGRLSVDFNDNSIKSTDRFAYYTSIEDLPYPKIAITGMPDIYRALTNADVLDKVLYQYLAQEKPGLNHKSNREKLIRTIMTFKNQIKMEELRDALGNTLADSNEEFERMQREALDTSWPSAKCFSCGSQICHILCTKCNVYMCKNHWRDHMVQSHSEMAKKYPPFY